ncbi:hypothetical protein A7P94_01585 [Eikenella sp. NML01-A-086]|nr:hypothetical protein A7P94_01585 [Eikenella sp. NML01-A-086]
MITIAISASNRLFVDLAFCTNKGYLKKELLRGKQFSGSLLGWQLGLISHTATHRQYQAVMCHQYKS